MQTSVVTTKGQLVIPSRIRHKHGIKKGTRVCFIERASEIIIMPITDEYIDGIKGSLGTEGKILKLLMDEKKRDHAA